MSPSYAVLCSRLYSAEDSIIVVFLQTCVCLYALPAPCLFLVFLLFEIIGVSLNQWNSPKGTAPAQPTACPANQSPPAQPTVLVFCPLSVFLLLSLPLFPLFLSYLFPSSKIHRPFPLFFSFILSQSPSCSLSPTIPPPFAVSLH